MRSCTLMLFVLFLVAVVVGPVAQRRAGAAEGEPVPPPESSHSDSTVALWLFDEGENAPLRALLEDQTTRGHDLTLDAGARVAAGGRFGNALEILGAGRTAVRRYIDRTPLTLGEFDWTWECWVKMKTAAPAGSVLFEAREGPFDRGLRRALLVGEAPDRLTFVCGGREGDTYILQTDSKLFMGQSDEWHHLALTYSAAGHRLTHWANGQRMDSVELQGPLQTFEPNGENNFSLGGDINGWQALPAFMDEARVSDRVIYREGFALPASFAPPEQPVKLGTGPHLFIDDSLIASADHLIRATHQPKRLPDPIIPEREIRPGWTQQAGGTTALYDEQQRIFRMWMCVKNEGLEGADFNASTYWESDDGVNWRAPELGLFEFDGHRKHNLIMTGGTHNMRFHSDGILDAGPDAADPARRYKIGYFPYDWKDDRTRGMNVAFSGDGIHWTAYEGNPVLRKVPPGGPGAAGTVADINDLFYDEQRKLYVQTYKTFSLPFEYPMAPAKRDERWKGVNAELPGYRRVIGMCTSPDFVHWSNFQRVMMPDDLDSPELQFYAMSILKRGDLYIAHVRCLEDQAEADGIGWMELATSRDLYHWTRHRDVFFDRNVSGRWDSAICWHGRPVIKGDEMYFYYTGLGGGHKTGTRSLGLAKLRKDGYVSRDARDEGGGLLTVPLIFDASRMLINAEVTGDIKVRIVDVDGSAKAGFDYSDMTPLKGISVEQPVGWSGSLSALRGKPLRIEFSLNRAKLYGFELRVD